MDHSGDGGEQRVTHGIVGGAPRWFTGAAIFAVGVGVGTIGFALSTSNPDATADGSPSGADVTVDGPPSGGDVVVDDSIAVGCGPHVTLIVDVRDLPAGTYELRASVGDRMLPMTNPMTHPLIGAHRGHQSVVPDDGRLLVVANVPLGKGNALRYELVRGGSEPTLDGVLQRDTCAAEG